MKPPHAFETDMVKVPYLYSACVIHSEASGKRTIKAKVPDTITSWHLSAFAMSSSTGMGVANPSTLTVFQPFFVSFTLPYSVIRGEQVSVIATVFNHMEKCATVSSRTYNSVTSTTASKYILGFIDKSQIYLMLP